jgi:hypothetical protein
MGILTNIRAVPLGPGVVGADSLEVVSDDGVGLTSLGGVGADGGGSGTEENESIVSR